LHVFCDGEEMQEPFGYSFAKKAFLDTDRFYYVAFDVCGVAFHLYLSFGDQHLDGNKHLSCNL